MFSGTDRGKHQKDQRDEGQDEEACAEESEDLGWSHAKCSTGIQTQRIHWLQSQSENSEEGGGEGKTIYLSLQALDWDQPSSDEVLTQG